MTTVETTPAVVNTSKADPAGLYIYNNTIYGVGFGVELADDGKVTAALAVCSPKDHYSRKRARQIITARIALKRFESKDPKRVPLTFPLGTYQGSKFKEEVFQPIMDYIRENVYLYTTRGCVGHPRKRLLQREFIDQITSIRTYDQAHLA